MENPKLTNIDIMIIAFGFITAIFSFIGIFLVGVRIYDHVPWNPDALLLFVGVFALSVAYLIRKFKACTQ